MERRNLYRLPLQLQVQVKIQSKSSLDEGPGLPYYSPKAPVSWGKSDMLQKLSAAPFVLVSKADKNSYILTCKGHLSPTIGSIVAAASGRSSFSKMAITHRQKVPTSGNYLSFRDTSIPPWATM
ncbi:hypothetical protein NXS19_007311 [Fusarium pseudograminearum]|nr:hypothetical protein NXS19_007311 [Fusarium pseudograminearum]